MRLLSDLMQWIWPLCMRKSAQVQGVRTLPRCIVFRGGGTTHDIFGANAARVVDRPCQENRIPHSATAGRPQNDLQIYAGHSTFEKMIDPPCAHRRSLARM